MRGRRFAIAFPAAITASFACVPVADAAPISTETCTSFAEDGQRLRKAGKLLDAREKLMQCSVADCPQVVRVDCAQWASEVVAATPTLVVDAKDASGSDVVDAKVYVDDRVVAEKIDGRPIAVDPGTRIVRIERGTERASERIVAKENAKGRFVTIRFAAASAESPAAAPAPAEERHDGWGWQQWSGLGLMVVGAIGIAYGTVGFVANRARESDLRQQFEDAEASAKTCRSASADLDCASKIQTREDLRAEYDENEKDGEDSRPLWLVGTIGGLLFVGGGAVLIFAAPKSSVRVAPTAGGLIVRGTF